MLASALSSAVFAGAVAIGATVAIERLGGRKGGVLGSLPTTIVPASLGIAAESLDDVAFTAAMAAVPGGMVVNALFLWVWRVLPSRLPEWGFGPRLVAMVGASLAVWAGAAALLVGLNGRLEAAGVAPVVVGWTSLGLLLTVGIAACWTPPPAPKGKRRVSPLALLSRGSLAALAIGVAVVIAGLGSPLLAGMASVFPAIFLTTMVSMWVSQGSAVGIGAVGPMMLGSSAVSAYAMAVTVARPALGTSLGAAVSWALAVLLFSWPASAWLSRRPEQLQ